MATLTVDIPADMAQRISLEVEAGTYRSESEIVLAGLEAILDPADDVESWLRTTVLQSYREVAANPACTVPIDDVEARLAERTRDVA